MAVGTLRQIDREVIILRYFEGIELTQMAAILDVTAHAVESRLVTFAEIDLRTDLPNDSPRSAFIFVIP
jgi:DNA-directed RNA polymerase specialized sigma subunit